MRDRNGEIQIVQSHASSGNSKQAAAYQCWYPQAKTAGPRN